MGKGSSSAPSVPDPVLTANAQASANKDTAIATSRLNQINEITPYGSSIYSPTGQSKDGIDQYQRTVTLSPQQQAILDAQNASTIKAYGIGQNQLDTIGSTLSTPLDFSGLPAAPSGDNAYRQDVQDALYGRAKSQLDPLYQDQQRKLETQLVNEGFARGGEGYNHALDRFDQTKGNAYESAIQDSITNAGNSAAQQFGMQSSARQNALAELLQKRNQPISELAALLGTSGGMQTPQFSSTPQSTVAPTDVTGPTYAAYNAQLGQYNQQQQNNNAMMGSLFGLAGTALGGWLSDPALKTDVAPIDHEATLNSVRTMDVPSWRYKNDSQTRVGPMADAFAERFGGSPHMIDGATAFGVALSSIKALANKVDALQRRTG